MKTADISVEYVGHYGSDETVVNAARVSFDKDAANYTPEQNDKLITYLAKNKHFSPFNHAFLSFKVKAPIFVGRQLVKHKFLPWNEVSRRYVDSKPEFYIPKDWRLKADNVKQGSSDETVWLMRAYGDGPTAPIWECVQEVNNKALKLYFDMMEQGVCPEMARSVLPVNMMTEWVWSGTLGAFLDMLVLRLDPHTQYESRIVAQQIAAIVADLFPVSYKARIE